MKKAVMNAYPNHTKRRLAAGRLTIGMGLHQARTVDIASIAKSAGFDWLFIDMEHSALDLGIAAQIACAALPLGVTPIVRVPGKEHHHASRMLDAGAQGIVVPHVETAEEARQAVMHCRYPPAGQRSVLGMLPHLGYRSVPAKEFIAEINDEILVVVMLETPRAIENAEAIAAVPGVDVLEIGTGDLCVEMGIPGQISNPLIENAYEKVLAACRRHGKHAGMGGVFEHALLEKYIRLGVKFVSGGFDISFLLAGANQRAKFLRDLDA